MATGDGIALAYRAGAEVQDMEFIQFHPTALRLPGVPAVPDLGGRARRGRLLRRHRRASASCRDYDERAELAPRDVVARAIVERMQRTGATTCCST